MIYISLFICFTFDVQSLGALLIECLLVAFSSIELASGFFLFLLAFCCAIVFFCWFPHPPLLLFLQCLSIYTHVYSVAIAANKNQMRTFLILSLSLLKQSRMGFITTMPFLLLFFNSFYFFPQAFCMKPSGIFRLFLYISIALASKLQPNKQRTTEKNTDLKQSRIT